MSIQPGLVFADRFRIERPIGSGGVGLVYQAQDLDKNQAVAIKCLRTEWAEHMRIRRRFMREARAISRLNHVNIVKVFDYGEDAAGVPFIAMEYLDGASLADLREQQITLPTLLELIDQVLSALAYIHARRIVHRDIKPENIIVIEDDGALVAKLLDFGFARDEEDQDHRLSQTKFETFGTPQYMAPEQATGKGPIGPPTDLYALGISLFEFIAGAPPFTGTHGMAIALKHLMEPLPALKPRAGMQIPSGLEAVIYRVLAKAPEDRYPSAADMRRAIAPFRGVELDDDVTIPGTAVADAAAHIVRIASETAMGRGEAGALFPTVSMAALEPNDAILRDVDDQPLVGREPDLVEMWSRVRRVCESGEGHVVLLGAEPGMGRRDVVAWLQEQVAEGGWMRVVGADAGPAAALGRGGLPALLEDLFEGLPPDHDAAQTRIGQLLMRWAASTYESSTSEAIAGVLAGYLRPTDGKGERESVVIRRACEAIRMATRERPVLLSLIAADEADLQTKTFLYHLARSLDESPFPALVVLTYAEEDGGPMPQARQLLAALDRVQSPIIERYRLAPLSNDATAAFLRTFAEVDDDTIRPLIRCARGNPLMARELLLFQQKEGAIIKRSGVWTLSDFADPHQWPRSLADVFMRRCMLTVAGLPDAQCVGQVLRRMAVLGEAAEHGLVVNYLTREIDDEGRVERAIESLLRAHVLVEQRGGRDRLRFAHPVLRPAILAQSRREPGAHQHAAEALLSWYGDDARRFGVAIAEHFVAAGDTAQAGHWFAEAGQLAKSEGRTADARAYLEQAGTLLGRGMASRALARRRAGISLQLSEIDLARGDDQKALAHAEKAAQWANQAGEPSVGAEAMLLIGDATRRRGDLEQAVRAYRRAAEHYVQLNDDAGIGKCLLGQAFAESSLRHLDQAGALFEQARVHLHQAGDQRNEARAVRGCAEIALRRADYARAGQLLEIAQTLFQEAGDRHGAVACAWLLGETSRLLGQIDAAIAHYRAARAGYVGQGNLSGMARSDLHIARLLARQDQWIPATTSFAQAAQASAEQGDWKAADAVWEEWVRLALGRRAFSDAFGPARSRLARAIDQQDQAVETIARAQLAWIAAESGDANACRTELRAAVALDRVLSVTHPDLADAFAGLAQVFSRYGHAHRAAPLDQRAARIRQRIANQRR